MDRDGAAYTTGKDTLGRWRVAPGGEVHRVRFRLSGKGARELSVSPQGDLVAAACEWDGLQIALASGRGPWMLSTADTLGVAFLANGDLVAGSDQVLHYPVERARGSIRFLKPRTVIAKGESSLSPPTAGSWSAAMMEETWFSRRWMAGARRALSRGFPQRSAWP